MVTIWLDTIVPRLRPESLAFFAKSCENRVASKLFGVMNGSSFSLLQTVDMYFLRRCFMGNFLLG